VVFTIRRAELLRMICWYCVFAQCLCLIVTLTMLYCIYAVSCLQIIIDNSSLYVNRCFHYQHSCWYYIYFDNKCLLVEKGKPIPSPILAILVCKIRHSLAGGRGRVGVQDCFRELHRAGSHIPTKTGPMWVYYTGRCIHNFSTRTASLVRQGFCACRQWASRTASTA
jgi:hypothetical protein